MTSPKEETGWLAKTFGNEDLPLQVCKAGSGIFYLGTLTPDGLPYSRESVEYWTKREEAERALKTGHPSWTQRSSP
jgi:hypothetical protein